ncbi:RES domain-containing protein [Rhodohalobacter sp. SW132]|uniref:RES family NAD+ phosphorylase n=1 Tax=Rhodohalobacter sp. SW132 TaxID=2293433 RepID=UPI000E23FA43|nr:RES family NAD+ phosphorylase [Rhodohalobacter sp. SW132]REL24907.1 RES domain-containing protein [Rhodohalobacter sp. SW132]
MIVYRITTAKWADKLTGSGFPARWNPRHVHVVYTAGSIALACLENLVHRSGEGLNLNFRLTEIEIPESASVTSISVQELPEKWHTMSGYPACQQIGRDWVDNGKSCLLRVPSSIIPDETNVLINPNHPEFEKIFIKEIREFSFDERLMKSGHISTAQ